jgi:GcrA cell cycle regulator
MISTPWTDEQIELLKQLWALGLPASEIGSRLGGFTRNAVLGKVHRLGLDLRKPPPLHSHRRPRQKRKDTVLVFKRPIEPETAPAKPVAMPSSKPNMRRLQVWQLEERMCRWPVGDPRRHGFFFCGADAREGEIYCPHHMGRAFSKGKAA